jgi:acetyltransferase-like isoleucine patch superfamily enzyme
VLMQSAISETAAADPLFYEPQHPRSRLFGPEHTGGSFRVLKGIWFQNILGFNRGVPWPMNPRSTISNPRNISFDVDDLDKFQSNGCYFQNASAHIATGEGNYISPNVGIITANHDPSDPKQHLAGRPVTIGRECWIGMNAVLLPGTELGDHTTVGANTVVTKSFPEGHCTLAGVAARLVRRRAPIGEAAASDDASKAGIELEDLSDHGSR